LITRIDPDVYALRAESLFVQLEKVRLAVKKKVLSSRWHLERSFATWVAFSGISATAGRWIIHRCPAVFRTIHVRYLIVDDAVADFLACRPIACANPVGSVRTNGGTLG
jgi:hypothetical protein